MIHKSHSDFDYDLTYILPDISLLFACLCFLCYDEEKTGNDRGRRKGDLTPDSLEDEAVDAMVEKQDVETVLSCARRYFSGQQGKSPVWEIMSDKPAKPVKDISSILRSMVE